MECFICCSKSGKTDQDRIMELIVNRRKFAYPLILLSDAYGCECKTTKAHNKCLINITKCPISSQFVYSIYISKYNHNTKH